MSDSAHQSTDGTRRLCVFNRLLAALGKYLWVIRGELSTGLQSPGIRLHRGLDSQLPAASREGTKVAGQVWVGLALLLPLPGCCSHTGHSVRSEGQCFNLSKNNKVPCGDCEDSRVLAKPPVIVGHCYLAVIGHWQVRGHVRV